MDRTARSIVFSIFGVLGVSTLAFVVSVIVPYQVNQTATIEDITGAAEIVRDQDTRATLVPDDSEKLRIGETVRVEPGNAASVVFFNQGRAVLTGPAAITLVESYQKATTLGHMVDSSQFKRRYGLTIKQMHGTVQYYFDHSDPAFEAMTIKVQLPNGSYQPDSPCWQITISADQTITPETLSCPD
ncbi:MAG TPA: hypothetical protein VHP83_12265 [Aggregatilineaceae bacterium]|nr:hypothetical protein [Aggregatilineaceae bacterium]